MLSDDDQATMKLVKQRYGQQSDAGLMRLSLRLVAQAKEIVLELPVSNLSEPKPEE